MNRLERRDTLEETTLLFDLGPYQVRRGKLAHAMGLIEDYHYTARRTADPMYVFLLTDEKRALAAAVYTAPVNRYFGKGAVELARLVREPELTFPLSRFVAATLRFMRQDRRELRYCLAYADSTVGHHGGIYQALNFTYVRTSRGNVMYRHVATGRLVSGRSFDQHAADNKDGWERLRTGKKYLYVYPLNEPIDHLLPRFDWTPLPYPKPALTEV